MRITRITAACRLTLAISGACMTAALLIAASLATAIAPAQGSVPVRKEKAPTLASMLLTVSQMPIGWSVDNTQSSGSTSCLGKILEPTGIKQTGSATVNFADNGSVPEVGEKLATYAVPASKVFAKIVATIDRCKTLTGTAGGYKMTGTVGQMSFPRYGDQSAAFAATLTAEELTYGEDVLVVRKGSILFGIAEDSLGSPDLSQFQSFVGAALKRVQ
jgi:hypothetical protein